MSSPLHDLLERAASAPTHEVDIDRLVGAARARGRRRRGLVAGLAAIAAVAAVLGLRALDDSNPARTVSVPPATQSGETVLPDGWQRIDLPQHGLSVGIPPTWTRLAPDTTGPVSSLFVVGSAPRGGVEGAITACATEAVPPTPGTWVSLYEYPPDGPFPLPTGDGALEASSFVDGLASNRGCSGVATEGSSLESIAFVEGGRYFVARIVTVQDPDDAGIRLGHEVLDTLRVVPVADHVAEPTTSVPERESTRPTDTTSVGSTFPQSDDELALRAVLLAWMSGERAGTVGEYVEDYDELEPFIEQGMAQHAPEVLASFRGVVDDLTFVDDTHASFHFTQSKLGSVLFGHIAGTAVKIDGQWKVSRETMCDHLARGGITCPPRSGSGAPTS